MWLRREVDIHVDCRVLNGHHLDADYVCKVCGKDYTVFMMSDVYVSEIEKCDNTATVQTEDGVL